MSTSASTTTTAATAAVVEEPTLPDLKLLDLRFKLKLPNLSGPERDGYRAELFKIIEKENMAPLYHLVCEETGWPKNVELVARMELANKKALEELDAKIKDAEENHGESEVREALMARANYLCRIGNKEGALTAFRVASDKTVSLSQRLDISFTQARMGFFFDDNDLVVRNIEKAKFQLEEGGDWDRKNRLKVYEGIHLMQVRDFKGAATLFLDGLASFTAVEVLPFEDYVFLTCITGLLALDRVTIKTKLMDSPEVLSVLKQLPSEVGEAMQSLYSCNYDVFFNALASLTEQIKRNHWLARHQAYFCREMRIRAYSQLLESYKSVQLKPMAATFGVTPEFLDRELSRFIFSGRLHCKIDKVAGVVHTVRADAKTDLYNDIIRSGDELLNSVQRLSRVVNL